jgi:hypothetical protein
VLLTRSRLCPGPKPGSSLHLHVLSTPPAFVLSQDQTLRKSDSWQLADRKRPAGRHKSLNRVVMSVLMGAAVHVAASLGLDEVLYLAVASAEKRRSDGSNLDATNKTRGSSLVIARC